MSDTKNSGISSLSLLTIAFIILKLCHVIDWDWIYVIMPSLIGTAIFIIALIILLIKHDIENRGVKKQDNKGFSKWEKRMEEMRKQKREQENEEKNKL